MGVSTGNGAHLCQAVNARGEPCGAYAVTGSRYCFYHDPDLAAERKAARAKGGRVRHGRKLTTGSDGPTEIASMGEVVDLLEQTINDCLKLENSIARARAIGYLAGTLARVMEMSELEQRIVALEIEVLGE